MENLNNKIVTGMKWKLLENFSIAFVGFVIQIILARILFPQDYGLIAIALVFINLVNVVFTSGLISSLIQKKDVNEVEYSSVFYFNVVIAIFLYFALFFTAPLISSLYALPALTIIIRIQSISILFLALNSVHQSMIYKKMEFKKSFKYKIISLFLQGITGILLALLGLGVWALVASYIVQNIVSFIILWTSIKWKPKKMFSFYALAKLLPFGSRMLFLSLINTAFINLKSLLIGLYTDTTTLGYYSKGDQIPTLIMLNTDGAINSVMFSGLSKIQNDSELLLETYKKTIRISVFSIYPIMVGIYAIANPLIDVLLTDKWLPSIPYMKIIILICLTWPFSLINQVYNSTGNSRRTLIIELINKGLQVIFIFYFIKYSVFYMLYGILISSIISTCFSMIVFSHFYKYKLISQILDIIPTIISSLAMLIAVQFIISFFNSAYLQLIFGIFSGIIVYSIFSIIINRKTVQTFLSVAKRVIMY